MIKILSRILDNKGVASYKLSNGSIVSREEVGELVKSGKVSNAKVRKWRNKELLEVDYPSEKDMETSVDNKITSVDNNSTGRKEYRTTEAIEILRTLEVGTPLRVKQAGAEEQQAILCDIKDDSIAYLYNTEGTLWGLTFRGIKNSPETVIIMGDNNPEEVAAINNGLKN